MTNRIDHTNCSHSATPAGRKWCREMRKDAIRQAQKAYMKCQESGNHDDFSEYYALVDHVGFLLGLDHDDAYDLVERGPVVY